MSAFLSTSDDNDTTNHRPCCRICFASNQTLMIPSPCNCSGTVGSVHKSCLREWTRSARNFTSCEICHGQYDRVVFQKRYFEEKQRKGKNFLKKFCLFVDICHISFVQELSQNYSRHFFVDLFTHSVNSRDTFASPPPLVTL